MTTNVKLANNCANTNNVALSKFWCEVLNYLIDLEVNHIFPIDWTILLYVKYKLPEVLNNNELSKPIKIKSCCSPTNYSFETEFLAFEYESELVVHKMQGKLLLSDNAWLQSCWFALCCWVIETALCGALFAATCMVIVGC